MKTGALFQRALQSARSGRLTMFSRLMQEVVPFNRPHRIRVVELSADQCMVLLPWRRRNLNHVGTMHACALATAAEYASGLCLLNAMEHQRVRLVMANLNITYPRRAQSACTAVAKLDSRHLEDILAQLDKEGRGRICAQGASQKRRQRSGGVGGNHMAPQAPVGLRIPVV